MGVDGDDGIELLRQLERMFGADMTACRPNRHFGTEGFVPLAPLYWLLLAWRALVEKGSTPESRARLIPIRVQYLFDSARNGKWVIRHEEEADG